MNATTPLLQGATALTGATGMDWAGALRARVLDEGVLSVSPVVMPLHGTGLPFAGDDASNVASSLLIGAHVAPYSTRDDATGLPPRGAPV